MPPRLPISLVVFLACACGGPRPAPSDAASVGLPTDGYLIQGASLPDQGHGFVRARPGEETRFGTHELVSALTRASAAVADAFPGSAPVRIGDLSYPDGGRHPRHHSHRTGRDADIIFYATDGAGRSTRGRGWLAFDRFGLSRESRAALGGQGSGDVFFFDEARNWRFVRTLLLDPEAEVQWLFVSHGVKSRLLRYAAVHEPNAEALFRASWVLHQPSSGNPHADHFHLRVFCGARQRALGCQDPGPRWAWVGEDTFKLPGAAASLDDPGLLAALSVEDAAPAEDAPAREDAPRDDGPGLPVAQRSP